MDVDGVTAVLFSCHQILAASTKVQELAINEIQAKTMAGAIANVARHYDTSGLNQKTADWCNLAMVLGVTYTPIIKRVANARRERRAAQNAPADGTAPEAFDPNSFVLPDVGAATIRPGMN